MMGPYSCIPDADYAHHVRATGLVKDKIPEIRMLGKTHQTNNMWFGHIMEVGCEKPTT